jgi:hypothetical protein
VSREYIFNASPARCSVRVRVTGVRVAAGVRVRAGVRVKVKG